MMLIASQLPSSTWLGSRLSAIDSCLGRWECHHTDGDHMPGLEQQTMYSSPWRRPKGGIKGKAVKNSGVTQSDSDREMSYAEAIKQKNVVDSAKPVEPQNGVQEAPGSLAERTGE